MNDMTADRMWTRRTIGLISGSTLAGFGGWIDLLAILTLAAYEYHAGAFVMAFISASFLVPGMLLAPKIGKWIDRGHADSILIWSLLARCVATALLLFTPALPIFCLIVALRSTLTIPTEPASNVLVTKLVKREDVPQYFGILGVLRNISKITAPTIGAAIASRFGEADSLYLSIAMTLVAVGCISFGMGGSKHANAAAALPIDPPEAASDKSPESKPSQRPSALLIQLTWTVTLFVFMVFFINNQLPVLLRNGGFDKALLGILVSCSGAGGILSATYMSRRKLAMSADPMRATVVAVYAIAAAFVGLGLAFLLPPKIAVYFAGVLFFCTGVFSAIEAIRSNTVVVQHFPSRVGAVSATIQAYQNTAMLAAPWLAALVLPYLSMSSMFVADGLLALVGLTIVSIRFGRESTKERLAAAVV